MKTLKVRYLGALACMVLLVLGAVVGGALTPSSEVVAEGALPASVPTSDFIISNTNSSDVYVEPTNSATNAAVVQYFFVTYNTAYTNGAVEMVKYNGESYPATVMLLTETTMSGVGHPSNTPWSVTGASLGPFGSGFNAAANTTYFFDEGNFVDDSNVYNYKLTATNSAIVGLKKDANGEPLTKIYKAPYHSQTGNMAAYNGYLPRFMASQADAYLENIIFDGMGYDMGPNGGGLSSTATGRGEFFWLVDGGAPNFVMRDVILQNVGFNTTDGTTLFGTARKNVAINIVAHVNQPCFFENVKIRNIMTKSAGNFGTVSLNSSSGVYFKNLDLSQNTQAGLNSFPVKLETGGSGVIEGRDIVFAGTLHLPDVGNPANRCVYVQDYRYGPISVPESYRYVLCSTTNGSSTSAAMRIYEQARPFANNTATLDLSTNWWLMSADNSAGTGNATLNQQMTSLKATINRILGLNSLIRIPDAYIEISPRADGTITGFTIPDFVDGAGYNDSDRSVAIYVKGDAVSETALPTAFVPFETGVTLVFPATNTAQAQLFGVDFASSARYSIEDATTGGAITNFVRGNSGSNLFYTEFITVVFYNQHDHALIDTQLLSPGSTPVAPEVSLYGHAFVGWSLEATATASQTLLTSAEVNATTLDNDTSYYAVFAPRTDITYVVNHYYAGTTDSIAPSQTFSGATFGTEVTGVAASIFGHVADAGFKTLLLDKVENNEITFYYSKIDAPVDPEDPKDPVEQPPRKSPTTADGATILLSAAMMGLGGLSLGASHMYKKKEGAR